MPAYGITTATIPQEYVTEAVAAVERKLQRKSGPPVLIGLSAGGFGACRLYARHPELFSRHLSLAAFPPDDVLNVFPRAARPAFLSGGDEAFVVSGDFARRMRIVRAACPAMQAGTIPGAGHFFMLTHREQTMAVLRTWIGW
ncbi:MAG: alpha/beta hydrolase [Kiritimatiellia bacterium]